MILKELDKTQKNAWMLSFIDLLSIILTFFILFYSLADQVQVNVTEEKPINAWVKDLKLVEVTKTPIHLLDLNYLKDLLQLKLSMKHFLTNYNIYIENDELILQFNINELFILNNIKVSAQDFLSHISELIANIDNKIYLVYEYNTKLPFVISRLNLIKQQLMINGYSHNIKSYLRLIDSMNLLQNEILSINIIKNK